MTSASACKELRYLLEFFASLYDPAIHRQAVRDLKGLQDCLGEYQDCQVQLHELRMFADQMRADRQVPATALLAMGELAGQIAGREQRASGRVRGPVRRFRQCRQPAAVPGTHRGSADHEDPRQLQHQGRGR